MRSNLAKQSYSMRNILLQTICLLYCSSVIAQDEFITTWEITEDFKTLTIEAVEGYEYNYSVDWGDGKINSGYTGDAVHTYDNIDFYSVSISGAYPKISIPQEAKMKLKSVEQWGNQTWQCMQSAFKNCENVIINTNDIPDLSEVVSLSEMFYRVKTTIGNIESWDVTNVTDMNTMFFRAYNFNQDIGNWNVAQVTNMAGMFTGAESFNQDIGDWDVGNVIDIASMFSNALKFNQDIGNWDMANVTDMSWMFYEASNFNQDIGNWNVANVTDMRLAFNGASSFNQDIGNWNVAQVTNMASMFDGASSFNQDIGNWNVGNITNMRFMFTRASSFNRNIGNWNVAEVTTMYSMFSEAISFNQDIGNWNVSNVNDMERMFEDATNFNQDIGNWNVSNVTNMSYMFASALSFNQDIGNWNVVEVTNMKDMFRGASSFNQDIGDWNVANVSEMGSMMGGATSFSVANYDALLIGWTRNSLQEDVWFICSSNYCHGERARQHIKNTYSWNFNDNGVALDCDRLFLMGSSFLNDDTATCENQFKPIPFLKYFVNEPFVSTFYISSINGEFTLPAYPGEFTVAPVLNNQDYFETSPDSIVLIAPIDDPHSEINFCITPKIEIQDVEISIIPLNQARPGFDVSYKLILTNKGTIVMDGEVEINYPSNLMSFQSADPQSTSIETGKIVWEYSDLDFFESRSYFVDFNLNSPMDNPPVNDGDILEFKAIAFPLPLDINRNDNYACLNQQVINAYDPNDKTCLEGSSILPDMVGEYLHYQIRFENSGTADAINVLVTDVIDRARFDISTLHIIDASHEMQVRIDGSEVEFEFNDIMLPFDDENNDGYVVFKIKTLTSLIAGDEISNEANIFFDFNFPILTNKALTTIDGPSSTENEKHTLNFELFPNPTQGELFLNSEVSLSKIVLYDAKGKKQILNTYSSTQNNYNFDISILNSGVYLLKVISSSGEMGIQKIVRH